LATLNRASGVNPRSGTGRGPVLLQNRNATRKT
jgi:hypothetical protein